MDVGQLEKQIQQDIDHGMQPFAVIATLGTTGTGAVDPLKEIAKLCVNRNLWLQADACYGGAAKLAPHLQHLFKGMQMADSLSVDPDKWFFIPTALLAVIKFSHGPFGASSRISSGEGCGMRTDGEEKISKNRNFLQGTPSRSPDSQENVPSISSARLTKETSAQIELRGLTPSRGFVRTHQS